MAKVEINPNFEEQLQAYAMREVKKRADFVWDEAQDLVPVKTGTLAASIRTVQTEDGYRVGSDCEYAGYQEYGTRKISPVAYLRRAFAAMLVKFRR